jgi:PTH1 family peptidyl-tRNA hydrolase
LKLILALGNPGDRYRDTRHNAGWWLADHLAVRWSFGAFSPAGAEASTDGRVDDAFVRIVKPLTYMNRSGRILARYLDDPDFRFQEDLLVLVDDASLSAGRFRLRGRGTAGGHNGLASVETALESREYGRLRIGVGGPHDVEIDLAAWVLAVPPAPEEEAVLEQFDRMALATERWIAEGIEPAMNAFNRT